ncbi:MAG TPA: phosphomannomutase/phosphoglucomutase [Polyangia bacterium]
MNPRVFREYDIRGIAERDFPDDFVADLGDAIGEHLCEAGARRITLARDCRLSSPRIHKVILDRLLAAGLNVQDVGLVHTPGLYYSVFHLEADGGVMITASHNPEEDNGFKIMRGKGTIFGAEIQKLRERIERRKSGFLPAAVSRGKVTDVDVLTPYIAHIVDNIALGPRRFKVVVDGGNGMGGITCVPILRKLGFEVDDLFCDTDGRFPNHHPDPTVPENLAALIARIRETGAEIGIALDGDADRIGVVDPAGRIVWGDQLLMLFAREILRERPGATFVSEVKCSQVMYDDITARGGRAIMWKVGHSLIKTKMKEEKAVLAGEMSGHMFFADRYFGFDDGVYAAARVVELLSRSAQPLSAIVDALPAVHNTPEIRVECSDDIKVDVVRRAREHYQALYPVSDVDGARISFPGGWGLVRASNTGPILVLRCEAESAVRLAEIRADIEGMLVKIKAALGTAT